MRPPSPHPRPGRTWVFDLDNTLYDARPQVFPRLHRAMADYLRRHCGIPAHEAGAVREHYWRRYGATLIGVMRHHGADPGHFLRETHDAEALAAEVRRGPGLRAMLARLPGRKLVFSNSPVHYSVAVLAALGIADLFDDVFAVEHTGYRPKPDRRGFLRLLRKHRLRAGGCIMVEDTLDNLKTAKQLGMKTVWMAGGCRAPAYVDFNVRGLRQLPRVAHRLGMAG